MIKETSRAATISKQRQDTGTPRVFYGTSLTRPPIAQQPLSAGVRKKVSTPFYSGPLDPDIVTKTSTPLENIFKIPATTKPKDSSLTIMATPKERIVQIQKKEDPFKDFVEIEPP